jgi:hypothetical protein
MRRINIINKGRRLETIHPGDELIFRDGHPQTAVMVRAHTVPKVLWTVRKDSSGWCGTEPLYIKYTFYVGDKITSDKSGRAYNLCEWPTGELKIPKRLAGLV